MMKAERNLKMLAFILVAVLLLQAVTPIHISAATASWAEDAVKKLNDIYEDEVFSADDTEVTVGDAKSFIAGTLDYTDNNINRVPFDHIFTPDEDSNRILTRKELCAIIFAVLNLPSLPKEHKENNFDDCSGLSELYQDAIGAMKYYGVVMGMPDNTFAPDDKVDNATFAVLFYRALRATGSLKCRLPNFKPGQRGAYETLYLELRFCLNPDNLEEGDFVTQFNKGFDGEFYIKYPDNDRPLEDEGLDNFVNRLFVEYDEDVQVVSEDVKTTTPEAMAMFINNGGLYKGKDEIWGAWSNRLNHCSLLHKISSKYYDFGNPPESDDFLDAIIQIATKDRDRLNYENRMIFSDVSPGNWYYDGIMYMTNHGLISGHGEGDFRPEDTLTRGAMAALIMRIKGGKLEGVTDAQLDEVFPDRATWRDKYFIESAYWAVINDYMTYVTGKSFDLDSSMTRQEMAYIVANKLYDDFTEENVNLTVLDRFKDKDKISEDYKSAVAYLVSIDVLGGNPDGTLDPNGKVSRAMGGVFLGRVLEGLDKSWMKDYQDVVEYVLD